MSNEQPTQQTNQPTNQPSKLEPANREPASFPLIIDEIVENYQKNPTRAIELATWVLTHFFKEAGIKHYMVVDFKYDTVTSLYDVSVTFPGMEEDSSIIKWSYDAAKEIEKLMMEYIAGNQPPPLIGLEGHIANAAVESVLEYAQDHGYKAVLFIGRGPKPKKTSDYDFSAILLKFD
jgi:nucleotide-binding universal stress UspA family protein